MTGLSTDDIRKLLLDSNGQSEDREAGEVFDTRDPWEQEQRFKDEDDPVSPQLWWNDLEKDSRYSSWPSQLTAVSIFISILIVILKLIL